MKKLFFLLLIFYIKLTTVPAHAQTTEQKCPCDKYHIEQRWNHIINYKDSLIDSLILFSKGTKEFVCIYYKNKKIFYSKIPQIGKWRINNITKQTICFNSGYDLQIFNLVTKEFFVPKIPEKEIFPDPN